MEAHSTHPTFDAHTQRRRFARGAGRTVAVVVVGGCLAGFGATGVAGAATVPDASPIFCAAGVPCGSVNDNPPAPSTTPTKKDAKDAKKAAKDAKKTSKRDALHGADLNQFLGDSSVIDNGGHRWG
jgi:hypothetical protein